MTYPGKLFFKAKCLLSQFPRLLSFSKIASQLLHSCVLHKIYVIMILFQHLKKLSGASEKVVEVRIFGERMLTRSDFDIECSGLRLWDLESGVCMGELCEDEPVTSYDFKDNK